MTTLTRISYLAWFAASLLAVAVAQSGRGDPVPFEEWLKGGHDAHIEWSLRANSPILGENQRMSVLLQVEVKAAEVEKRPGQYEFVLILQIRDQNQQTYRSHALPIRIRGPVPPDGWATMYQRLYVVPGDYEVAAAVYDTLSKEHSLKRVRFHVASPGRDPLPEMWRDMPRLGFQASAAPAKLWIPLETAQPILVEVIAAQPVMGTQGGNIMARLEVLSQMSVRNGSMGIRVLDLAHRKVLYSQEGDTPLDMHRVGAVLGNRDPRVVHADVLSKYQEGAQFLVEQVRSALERKETEEARVVIVLSAPWDFPKDPEVPVVQAELAPHSRVFYVRCDAAGYIRYTPPATETLNTRTSRPGPPASQPDMSPNLTRIGPDNSDSLARTLKLLPSRIIDVATPTDFRRALADIVREISQLN